MLTDKEIDEIEKRANAAMPGPWIVEGYTADTATFQVSSGATTCTEAEYLANLNFSAAARTDIPALISDLRKAREALRYYATLPDPADWYEPDTQTHFNDIARAALPKE